MQSGQNQANTRSYVLKLKHPLRNTCSGRKNWSYLRGHSHTESSHSFHQNDAKLQTHPPSILNVKMLNLPKIDVYNLKYKIRKNNVGKICGKNMEENTEEK